jgi:hypothetical protein
LDKGGYIRQWSWWRSLIYTLTQRPDIAKVNIERCLGSGLVILIEEVRHCQFNSIVGWSIYWRGEKSRERSNRNIRNIIVLPKCIEKRILEFSCRSNSINAYLSVE